jgi:hypothetical protein
MNLYQNGKIYKLVCNVTGLVYFGSTREPTLARRLNKHKNAYNIFLRNTNTRNMCSSIKVLENGDYDIVLVELFPCNSRDELLSRERFHIENNDCVNINFPIRTIANELEYRKTYYTNNIEAKKMYGENYRQNNKEKIKLCGIEYRKNNVEKVKEMKKLYVFNNKERIFEKIPM